MFVLQRRTRYMYSQEGQLFSSHLSLRASFPHKTSAVVVCRSNAFPGGSLEGRNMQTQVKNCSDAHVVQEKPGNTRLHTSNRYTLVRINELLDSCLGPVPHWMRRGLRPNNACCHSNVPPNGIHVCPTLPGTRRSLDVHLSARNTPT